LNKPRVEVEVEFNAKSAGQGIKEALELAMQHQAVHMEGMRKVVFHEIFDPDLEKLLHLVKLFKGSKVRVNGIEYKIKQLLEIIYCPERDLCEMLGKRPKRNKDYRPVNCQGVVGLRNRLHSYLYDAGSWNTAVAESALHQLPRTIKDVMSEIIPYLKDPESEVRVSAVLALDAMLEEMMRAGVLARNSALNPVQDYFPQLLECLLDCVMDEDSDVRKWVARILHEYTKIGLSHLDREGRREE